MELSVSNLIHLEKMSLMGQLLSGIVHELYQPLNSMALICQSLLRKIRTGGPADENITGDLRDVLAHIERMSDMIDHMRFFSHKNTGGKSVVSDINTIIRRAILLTEHQCTTGNIHLLRELKENSLFVFCDSILLEQVILNLLSNAFYAVRNTKREKRYIRVRTKKKDKNKIVICYVCDNGTGIPAEYRYDIFTPFFTTKHPGEGTGLGLHLSKKIIEDHNGTINISSTPGEGTTVRVILPLAE
ncbi:MAG: GHKL domain-containing protein [Spirochaetales bacterium]|nr:GHKL domain-containing protein [Spirochaetales bacterium]